MPSFAPRIRVEVYVPVRYEPAYQDTLSWLIREFTELRGGCTAIENTGGYYLSQANEIIDDRVSVVWGSMKRAKEIKELKIERPPRAKVSEKEALKRMKEFSKRKEQFLATARTGKGRGVRP